MSRLDELIIHYERRMSQCVDEIARIEKLPEGKHTTHEEHDRWIIGWEESRRICRDTIAYLETVRNREVRA